VASDEVVHDEVVHDEVVHYLRRCLFEAPSPRQQWQRLGALLHVLQAARVLFGTSDLPQGLKKVMNDGR
jgi:hypothetical protein